MDPFSASLVANLGKLAIEVASKMGAGMHLDKAAQQRWYSATGEYLRRYHKRHCQLQVLGMSKPMDLEAVYTAVQLLDPGEIRCFETLEGLEALYRKAGKRKLKGDPKGKESGITVANQEQYLMVLGGPGIGKSTFLRKTGLEALKTVTGEYQHQKIPVLLELKRLNSDQLQIEALVIEEFETCGFPNGVAFATHALEAGDLLVLLDGLDEVPTHNLDGVIQQISDFVSRYPKNRFITSCRIAAYHSFFKGFTEVAIAEFEDEQIEQFIGNYFCSELDKQQNTAQECWQLLQDESNAPAKELAQTPLLLTFLCLVYDSSQTFPPTRSLLYGKALDILLEEWAAEKRIKRDTIYQGLHVGLEKTMLAAIAFPSFEQNQLFLEKQWVLDLITEFLTDTLGAPKTLDAGKVLTAIEVQQGILVKRAHNTYSFSHLTLQEYLTAFEINDQRKTDWLIENHLTDDRWREIFLLVAGLMGRQADEFLAQMEKKAQDYINTPELTNLFEYLEWLTQEPHDKFTPLQLRLGMVLYNIDTVVIARDAVTDAIDIAIDAVIIAARDVTRDATSAAIAARNAFDAMYAIDAARDVTDAAIAARYAARYPRYARYAARYAARYGARYARYDARYARDTWVAARVAASVAARVARSSNSDHPEIFYFQKDFDPDQLSAQAAYPAGHVPDATAIINSKFDRSRS
jgi:hypothetical protein